MRRVGILVIGALAVVLIGFTAWSVSLLGEVSRLRADVEQRVGWLVELQRGQGVIADPSRAAEIPGVELALGALDADLLEHREASDPLAQLIATTLAELRGLRWDSANAARRRSVAKGLDEGIVRVRAETGELSAQLGDRWDSLRALAVSAIAMAAGLLVLTAYGLLVVAPRLRAHAMRLTALTQRLEDAAMTGRGLGHELGGPLTSVLTTLQFLRDKMRRAGQAKDDEVVLLDEAIAAMRRASGTLQDLRASSDSNEQPTADVQVALDQALAATRLRQAGKSQLTIDTERVGAAALPQPLVRRVFTQILATATDAVRVRTREEHGRIAVEFGFVTATHDETFAGLVRALAGLGGSLTVRDAQAERVVRVELPMGADAGAAQGPAPTPAPTRTPAGGTDPGLRVLLIDDDEFVLTSVSRVLARHQVVTQSDPTAGIEQAVAESFDLILCDVMMPGKSGMEVFAAVTEARPELADRFVFMSGGATERDVAAFLERAPARIDKPFGADELRRLVARYTPIAPRGATGAGRSRG